MRQTVCVWSVNGVLPSIFDRSTSHEASPSFALALVRPGSESSVDCSVGSTGPGRYT